LTIVDCIDHQSIAVVGCRDPIGLGVLQRDPINSWCFVARSNRLLPFFGEFSTGVEVFGEFLSDVGFLWNFSFFMFGLSHFLVFFICVLQAVPV
jgi:hypothetical protein